MMGDSTDIFGSWCFGRERDGFPGQERGFGGRESEDGEDESREEEGLELHVGMFVGWMLLMMLLFVRARSLLYRTASRSQYLIRRRLLGPCPEQPWVLGVFVSKTVGYSAMHEPGSSLDICRNHIF